MGSDDLPQPVVQLVTDCIDSAMTLEILLLLRRERDRSWSSGQVVRELRTPAQATEAALRSLSGAGLLSATSETFQFAPQSDQLRTAVDALADVYAGRRVKLIEFLYATPSDRVTRLSDGSSRP